MISNWPGRRLARRFMKQDKGSIILEGVVSLGIISVLTLGYTSVSTQATVTQRTAVNEAIAVQAAQDALEKAKATNWGDVGTDAASKVSLPYGVPAVLGGALPAEASPSDVRGLPITVRTAVGWKQKPTGPSDFGSKLVVVEVSWQDVAGDPNTAHTKPQEILITPGIGEAVPAGIRGSVETAPTAPPTPTPTPTPTPPPPPAPPAPKSFYADVSLTDPFYDDMYWMYTSGIHGGWVDATTGDRNYRPKNTSPRDFMAAYVYRQLGSPAFTAPATSPFTDVPTTQSFYKEITYLDAKGILPWDGTALSYGNQVTREEMAILFYRMAGRPAYTPPATSPFPDVPKTDPDYLEISWAKANGIMGSYADGTFKPATALTRDAMATSFNMYDALFGSTVPATYTDIDKKYDAVNGPTLLGAPTAAEVSGLVRGGKYRCYPKGCIMWSPDVGAAVSLSGPIRDKWGSLGFETSWMGYPANDGVYGLKGGGSAQDFEYGIIFYSPASGAHFVTGAIRGLWGSTGAQDGWLGYPTTDELYGMRDGGARQTFQGGYIYWAPNYGAYYLMGAIGGSWIARGAENSKYGYPLSNEFDWNGGRRQNFEGGYIAWYPDGTMTFS